MSFTKRAPEIAEEILLKASELPESLCAFSKSLLEKKAVDEREKLQLPKRMTLDDLRNLARENGEDLPKVASVRSDEFLDVASQLRKIAERYDREIAENVFTTAAALVASKIKKEAAGPSVVVRTQEVGPPKGVEVFTQFIPGTIGAIKRRIRKADLLARVKGTPQYSARMVAEQSQAMEELAREESKRRHKTITEVAKALPGVGAGVAGVTVAGSALAPGEKKEIKAREVIA